MFKLIGYLFLGVILLYLQACAINGAVTNSYMQNDLREVRNKDNHSYIYNTPITPIQTPQYNFTPQQLSVINRTIKNLNIYKNLNVPPVFKNWAFFVGYQINSNTNSLQYKLKNKPLAFTIYYSYLQQIPNLQKDQVLSLLTGSSVNTLPLPLAFDGGEYDTSTMQQQFGNVFVPLSSYYHYILSSFTKEQIKTINNNMQELYDITLKNKAYEELNNPVCSVDNWNRYLAAGFFTKIIKQLKLQLTPYDLVAVQNPYATRKVHKALLYKLNQSYFNVYYTLPGVIGLYYAKISNNPQTNQEAINIFNKLIANDYRCYVKLQ